MRKKSFAILRGILITTGYLNGIWLAIGFNPQAEIFKTLGPYVAELDPRLGMAFKIIPTALIAFILMLVFIHGRWKGLLAVLVAFFGGFVITQSVIASLIFLFAAFVVAYLAVNR